MKNFFDFSVHDAQGSSLPLKQFEGKLCLVVNVASQCGFTPQYEGLQRLYEKYRQKNFMVLAFPCNQFGAQEPGTNQQIQEFCYMNFRVSFPVLGKIDVNGDQADPVYVWLKSQAPGVLGTETIKWNFTKFLVSPAGKVLSRHAPQEKPESLIPLIEAELPTS
jgi:glutathione peroxidase